MHSGLSPCCLQKVCQLWIVWYGMTLEAPTASLSFFANQHLVSALCKRERRDWKMSKFVLPWWMINLAREWVWLLGYLLQRHKWSLCAFWGTWTIRARLWDVRTQCPRQEPWVYHQQQSFCLASGRASCHQGRTAQDLDEWLQPLTLNKSLPSLGFILHSCAVGCQWYRSSYFPLPSIFSHAHIQHFSFPWGNCLSPASNPNISRGHTPHSTHIEDGLVICI